MVASCNLLVYLLVMTEVLVGIEPFEEPEGLHYLQVPIDVQATPQEQGTRYDATFDHPPLDSIGLLALLNQIAPGAKLTYTPGIIDDWKVVDDAKKDGKRHGARDGYSTRLVKLHERLGGA